MEVIVKVIRQHPLRTSACIPADGPGGSEMPYVGFTLSTGLEEFYAEMLGPDALAAEAQPLDTTCLYLADIRITPLSSKSGKTTLNYMMIREMMDVESGKPVV